MSAIVTQPQLTRSHAVLIWLIRGTGALIAGASAIATIYFMCGIIGDATRGRMGSLGWVGVPIVILIVAVVLGLFFKIGYEMFRILNAITVANFAFTVT